MMNGSLQVIVSSLGDIGQERVIAHRGVGSLGKNGNLEK